MQRRPNASGSLTRDTRLGSREQIPMTGEDLVGSCPPSPPFVEDQVVQWQPLGPAAALQLGLLEKLLGVAQAQIGYRQDRLRKIKDPPEGLDRQDADPADTDALGAGG